MYENCNTLNILTVQTVHVPYSLLCTYAAQLVYYSVLQCRVDSLLYWKKDCRKLTFYSNSVNPRNLNSKCPRDIPFNNSFLEYKNMVLVAGWLAFFIVLFL